MSNHTTTTNQLPALSSLKFYIFPSNVFTLFFVNYSMNFMEILLTFSYHIYPKSNLQVIKLCTKIYKLERKIHYIYMLWIYIKIMEILNRKIGWMLDELMELDLHC